MARSQALDKSNKFLNEVQEKDLPKPFFISEREEENNVEEEKMRKVKEKQNQMEKEEQERRRNNKVNLLKRCVIKGVTDSNWRKQKKRYK